jgi:hypothetical protein
MWTLSGVSIARTPLGMCLNQVYEENVLCRRKDIRDGNMKLYQKTQTFERENMWVENVVGGKKKATN